MPELPVARLSRFIKDFSLPNYDAEILTSERETADYFENSVNLLQDKNVENYKLTSNWIMTDLLRVMKDEHVKIGEIKVTPKHLAELINNISTGLISGKIAKDIFTEMLQSGEMPKEIISKKGLTQLSDETEIENIVVKIIEQNPDETNRYREGKVQLIGFFVGEVMKATRGKANPKIVNKILEGKLKK